MKKISNVLTSLFFSLILLSSTSVIADKKIELIKKKEFISAEELANEIKDSDDDQGKSPVVHPDGGSPTRTRYVKFRP